jgi:hypothetical protein
VLSHFGPLWRQAATEANAGEIMKSQFNALWLFPAILVSSASAQGTHEGQHRK